MEQQTENQLNNLFLPVTPLKILNAIAVWEHLTLEAKLSIVKSVENQIKTQLIYGYSARALYYAAINDKNPIVSETAEGIIQYVYGLSKSDFYDQIDSKYPEIVNADWEFIGSFEYSYVRDRYLKNQIGQNYQLKLLDLATHCWSLKKVSYIESIFSKDSGYSEEQLIDLFISFTTNSSWFFDLDEYLRETPDADIFPPNLEPLEKLWSAALTIAPKYGEKLVELLPAPKGVLEADLESYEWLMPKNSDRKWLLARILRRDDMPLKDFRRKIIDRFLEVDYRLLNEEKKYIAFLLGPCVQSLLWKISNDEISDLFYMLHNTESEKNRNLWLFADTVLIHSKRLELYQREVLWWLCMDANEGLGNLKMDFEFLPWLVGSSRWEEGGKKQRVKFLRKYFEDYPFKIKDEIISSRLLYAAIGWHRNERVPFHFDPKSFKKYKDEKCYWKTFLNLKKVIDIDTIIKFKAHRVLPPIEIEGFKSKYLDDDDWPARIYIKNGELEVKCPIPSRVSKIDLYYKSRQIMLLNLLVIILLFYFNYLR